MKRAKIALTAVAMFAIIGGALAFKVRQERTFFKEGTDGKCTVQVLLQAKLTAIDAQNPTNTRLSVASTTLACPSTRTIFDE